MRFTINGSRNYAHFRGLVVHSRIGHGGAYVDTTVYFAGIINVQFAKINVDFIEHGIKRVAGVDSVVISIVVLDLGTAISLFKPPDGRRALTRHFALDGKMRVLGYRRVFWLYAQDFRGFGVVHQY